MNLFSQLSALIKIAPQEVIKMKPRFLQNGKHFDNNLAIVHQAIYESKLRPQLLEEGISFNDHSGGGMVSVRDGKVFISYPNHPILHKYEKVYSV